MKTKKSAPAVTAETLDKALYWNGTRPYSYKSNHAKYNAQSNLQGRTHYVDDDTLRGFAARILDAHASKDGLLFYLVESVNSRPNHGGKNKRCVVFDVFGEVVNDRPGMDDEGWHRTSAAAEKELRAFLESFDAFGHTVKKLREICARRTFEANEVLSILNGKA